MTTETVTTSRKLDALLGLVLLIAAGLLSIGLTRDYRLKHEDNNALFTEFAQSHLEAGLAVTRAHDAFYDPTTGALGFYGHHPPGLGSILAAVFGITGTEGPATVRTVAILFTLGSLVLLWWVVRRQLGSGWALLAASIFAVLPQSAFYGRMVNHEILALPLLILGVSLYHRLSTDEGTEGPIRTWGAFLLVSAVAAWIGWVAFFVLASCVRHALFLRAWRLAGLVALVTLGLFGLDLLHLSYLPREDGYLWPVFLERIGAGAPYGPLDWVERMLSYSRRLASTTGTIALIWLLVRRVRSVFRRERLSALEEQAGIFLVAGIAYLVVFNFPAWHHHYWQYPLLPAVVIGLVLLTKKLAESEALASRPVARAVLLSLIVLELLGTSIYGLHARHSREEARVKETVETLRSR